MMTYERPAGGHVNHWCEWPECDAWGAFGYSQGRDIESRWLCGQHRLHGWRQGDPITIPAIASAF